MTSVAETAAPTAPAPSAFDTLDPPQMDKMLDCVHCGFCLPTCPTYLTLGNEMDSPRGRLYLMRVAAEGRIGISDTFVKHMSRCLVCRACETACPSGVQFGNLMEAARGQVTRKYAYSPAERLLRKFVLETFTDPQKLRALIGDCRRNGYSVVEDELAYGVIALAVPVLDHDGRVVAALNSSSHSRRMTKTKLVRERLTMLQQVSRQISADLATAPWLSLSAQL